MNKKVVNEVYFLIAFAFIAIIAVDTLLGIHPVGNIIGAGLLLVACYRIGQTVKK